MAYEQSRLWKRTLGADYENEQEREGVSGLRSAFEAARKRIDPIVRQAHYDCTGLTIHDLSHLDALWQMADLIIGDDYPVNPVEAFVFGCSVLLHDAALAVAAYEGGLAAIKKTPQWYRAVEGRLRNERKRITQQDIDRPPEGIARAALFETLRAIHADQAATMMDREWRDPDNKTLHLMDDRELRSFYGQSVGRIAQSHHWNIDRVEREFSTAKSVLPTLPDSWYLNEIKVACMLRCADASHIDRRRAPTMEFILQRPEGVSEKHWRFQHQLGIPKVQEGRMIYTSARDFGRSDAEAWWLCYDTCRMISSELENSNAVLKESGIDQFAVREVEGVERPKSFAKYVRPEGWVPVDAEVRVSDPVHLAKTLGGQNLYGKGYAAPIRELLQNAIDATLLRDSVEKDRGNLFYRRMVRLSLLKNSSHIIIRVEDNGIGMSERILTSGLIDFGKSLWQTQASDAKIARMLGSTGGRFGIGFFSSFVLGQNVRVESKPFDKGSADALTLEFTGLSRRPIVVPGVRPDFPSDMSTRIDIALEDPASLLGVLPGTSLPSEQFVPNRTKTIEIDMFEYCRWITASADVEIEFIDTVGDRSFSHKSDWNTRSDEGLLRDLISPWQSEYEEEDPRIVDYSPLLQELIDDEGKVVGRAAISVGRGSSGAGYYRIGGLTYFARGTRRLSSAVTIPPFIGILDGEVSLATRTHAVCGINTESISKWASAQADVAQQRRLSTIEKVLLAQRVFEAGGEPGDLPFAYFSGRLLKLAEFKKAVEAVDHILIPLSGDDEEAEWESIGDAGARYFLDEIQGNVCIMEPSGSPDIFDYSNRPSGFSIEKGTAFEQEWIENINFGSLKLLFRILGKQPDLLSLSGDLVRIFPDGTVSRSLVPVLRLRLA